MHVLSPTKKMHTLGYHSCMLMTTWLDSPMSLPLTILAWIFTKPRSCRQGKLSLPDLAKEPKYSAVVS